MSQKLLNNQGKQEEEYKGEPLNPNIAYGPLEERGCRDIFFFMLFVLFWVGLFIIAGVAVKNGDPRRLATPFDSSGNQCGYSNASDYPYMFFSQEGQTSISNQIYACVKSCPKQGTASVECLTNKVVQNCNQLQIYPTTSFVTVCVPTDSQLQKSIKSQIDIGTLEEWMSDIRTTWPVSLGVAFIAFGVSFIFLILMRTCAGFITWSMIAGYFILLITLGSLCLYKSYNKSYENVPSEFQNQQALEALGYSLLVLAGISLLLFICFFNKIKRAVAIMKAASDFTRDVWQSFIVPVIMFILICGFFVFWIIISLYIYSSGEIKQQQNSPFGSVEWDVGVKRTLIYYLFGLFWNVEFFIGMSQLIIASCAAFWYFSHRPNAQLHNPVSKSIIRAFTLHIGSVCLGSMILSIVMLIRFLVELVYKEAKKNLNNNAAANCCIKCCLCCLRCFENFIRFINTNAYIMIGLSGNSFCTSAKDAFFLISRNAAQFSITQGIGRIFVFFGKFFITFFSAIMGYLIITNMTTYSEKIYSAGVPTFLFVVIAFCISSVFMSIYGMAADTLLMCLCSDKEINRGRPQSCPQTLQEFENEYMN
ncbi:hypothetical protein ABPG74_009818 [Tetrahymena malaccensis]